MYLLGVTSSGESARSKSCLFAKMRNGIFVSCYSCWVGQKPRIKMKCMFLCNRTKTFEIVIYLQEFSELFAGFFKSLGIRGVNDVDECVGFLIVVVPIFTEALLATNIANAQLEPIESDILQVESLSRLCLGDILIGKCFKNRSLAWVIESQN